jgi:hypothetical protein
MVHRVHIKSREQYVEALRVLNTVPGTWSAIGPSSAPVFLLPDAHYNALLLAGVVSSQDKEVNGGGKKATGKTPKS